MANKQMTLEDVVAELRSGMTIGIGGWASRRKPMALVRAIVNSELRDLTVVSFGGPDVGLLCAAGKVKHLIYGFVSLDTIALEPHFRRARESAAITVTEYDEGMLYWALLGGASRLPFLPHRAGLGSGVMTHNPGLRTVVSPYEDGEELVAVPGVRLDAALVHLNRADTSGNAQLLGPDLYFDDLFCSAAERAFVSCERLVEPGQLEGDVGQVRISRSMVEGVVETPNGAHFTSCAPDYGRDEAFQREYATAATDTDEWRKFCERYLNGDEAAYQAAVGAQNLEVTA